MNNIFLSICIPTYNRLPFLQELLADMLPAIEEARQKTGVKIECLISNNASTDGTEKFLETQKAPFLIISKNETNIGGNQNIQTCICKARGRYVWLFGDDDLLLPDAVAKVVGLLQKESPELLVLSLDTTHPFCKYQDYQSCLKSECKNDKFFALKHTLITSNVFERERYRPALAQKYMYTSYGHMFGLMNIFKSARGICVLSGAISMRPVRPDFEKWPYPLCLKQAFYLHHIAKAAQITCLRWLLFRLVINLPVETAGRLLHPFFHNIGRP